MIAPGDVVAVGVSGGKDSLALLAALAAFRDFGVIPFELKALMIDPGFSDLATVDVPPPDHSAIGELCRRLKVPFSIEKTQIAVIVFDERKEKNPCSLCANMRRGALLDLAASEGATKLALGHHLQDVAETAMMNLIHEGRFGCFSPVTRLEDRGISVIRPLILCDERLIKSFAKKAALPVEKSLCPADRATERAKVREILNGIDHADRGVDKRIEGALCRAGIDGWK